MAQSRPPFELSLDALRRSTDPTALPFQTTEHLPEPAAIFGQSRAREAMELALALPDGRFNLFVLSAPAYGGARAALRLAREVAAQRRVVSDWVYVYNFETPEEPIALELAAGAGRQFAIDVEAHIIACRRELRRAFSSDVYRARRAKLLTGLSTQHDRLEATMQGIAHSFAVHLRGTPSGYIFVPLGPGADGGAPEELTDEAIESLTDEQLLQFDANRQRAGEAISSVYQQVLAIEEQAREQARALDRDVAHTAVRYQSELIAGAYVNYPAVQDYLQRLKQDIVLHARILSDPAQGEARDIGDEPPRQHAAASEYSGLPMDDDMAAPPSAQTLMRRYGVNVMISRPHGTTVPVIEETNPTYANLVGRIDIAVRDGLQFTDHMMLKPGDLHKASGGFLVLQAQDVLTQPRAAEALSRVARFGVIELENGSQAGGGLPSATIRPQPIRADLKIILIGEARAYGQLFDQDSDFAQCFTVRADLDVDMPRDAEHERGYAELAGEVARSLRQPPLTSEAVALVVEEASRWAGDQERLTARIEDVRDLCAEASYLARRAGDPLTRRSHVAEAIAARERRAGWLLEKEETAILRRTTLIATEGAEIAQINGLYLHEWQDVIFGLPMRITASVSPGMSGVVTLDRESNLSGPDHTKGVLTLAGFLAGRFAEDFPLSLSASLTLEQTHDGVDGDSASAAELFALLSALAQAPLKQSLAVTGAVSQRGDIEVIGGVTAKVEGFFRICQQRGLTGEHGVVIPLANARNLMLRDEVIDAVSQGKFHIYGISTVEEGMLLLTGVPFGTKNSEGRYLEGTIAARVLQRLSDYSRVVRRQQGG